MKRRKIAAVAIALVMTTMLTACGKFTCDICGEEKGGKKHTKTVLGTEVTICDDCYKEINDVADAFKGLF